MSTTVAEVVPPARPGTLKILLREPAAAVSLVEQAAAAVLDGCRN